MRSETALATPAATSDATQSIGTLKTLPIMRGKSDACCDSARFAIMPTTSVTSIHRRLLPGICHLLCRNRRATAYAPMTMNEKTIMDQRAVSLRRGACAAVRHAKIICDVRHTTAGLVEEKRPTALRSSMWSSPQSFAVLPAFSCTMHSPLNASPARRHYVGVRLVRHISIKDEAHEADARDRHQKVPRADGILHAVGVRLFFNRLGAAIEHGKRGGRIGARRRRGAQKHEHLFFTFASS